jgi:hypothetical protein
VTCCAAASRENACCGLARFPGGHRPGHRQRPCRRRCETARHTSQPVAISRCGSSTPTMKRSCFRRRAVAGIEDVISRADLADRGIFLTLAPIGERQRRSEAELWREFEIARPRILGALLDATMRGLRTLPNVRLTSLPRMADFVLWATACEPGLWSAATFARAYDANRRAGSRGASSRTRWRFACGPSWPSAAAGRGLPQTFCVPPALWPVPRSPIGPKIPLPSRAGCVVRRRSFVCWALKYPSLARGERAPGRSA